MEAPMKPKLHPVKTQTGEYIPAAATDVSKTFDRERKRLKEIAEKQKSSNVHKFADIFKEPIKRG
jgi:hypothetical protein